MTASEGLVLSSPSSGRCYKLEERLGGGASGIVWRAVDANADAEETSCERDVAIKLIEIKEQGKGLLLREVENQSLHDCPHLVSLHEEFRYKGYVCLVMEYMPGGTLHEFVSRKGALDEDLARWYFQQMIVAITYLHANGLVMRDVKLSNMVLDKNKVLLKLCDFGASKRDRAPCTYTGTPAFLAPELVRAFRANMCRSMQIPPYDGQAVDVWCCGVCLFTMLYGSYPFDPTSSSLLELMDAIVTCNPGIPDFVHMNGCQKSLSHEVRDLMARIFVSNPNQRITMEEIIKHPWFLKDLPCGAMDMLENFKQCFDADAVIRMRRLPTNQELEQKLFSQQDTQEFHGSSFRWNCRILVNRFRGWIACRLNCCGTH